MFILDVHTHTVASGHAYSTILENIKYGKEKGLELIGVSDHAPTLPGGTYIFYFQNLKHIPSEIHGVKILKGAEVNIIDKQGGLDMMDENLAGLDYAIASVHPPCIVSGTKTENTNMVIKAMESPYIDIIGHPDDGRYPLDYKALVEGAKATKTLLELNNSSLNPNGFRVNVKENVTKLLEECAKQEVSIVCGSDAHFAFDVGRFDFCKAVIKELDFPEHLIVNNNVEQFLKFIRA